MDGGESGFSAADWVSVLLAGAAFFVSIASLYYAALRRPSLDLDVLSTVLSPSAFEGQGMPIKDSAQVTIYLANSGAAGTFVEDIDVTDFKHHGDGLPLWSGIDEEMPVAASWGVGKETVFERSDAHRGTLTVYLARSPGIATAEEVARRVAGLRSVEVSVRWAFRRARLLRPGQRETKHKHVPVSIEGTTYRAKCVAEWRKIEETRRLADIAEGKDPLLG